MRTNVARYAMALKHRAVARSLPPENAALEVAAREVGNMASTLSRWRDEVQARPVRARVWAGSARFEAVVSTA